MTSSERLSYRLTSEILTRVKECLGVKFLFLFPNFLSSQSWKFYRQRDFVFSSSGNFPSVPVFEANFWRGRRPVSSHVSSRKLSGDAYVIGCIVCSHYSLNMSIGFANTRSIVANLPKSLKGWTDRPDGRTDNASYRDLTPKMGLHIKRCIGRDMNRV